MPIDCVSAFDNAFVGMEIGVGLFFVGSALTMTAVVYMTYLRARGRLPRVPGLLGRRAAREGELSPRHAGIRRLHAIGLVTIVAAFAVASVPYGIVRLLCH